MKEVVPLTLLSLKQLMETDERLIVLDCYAKWCGPCKRIAPEVEQLETKYDNKILVLKVDIEECDDISEHFKINSMPTFLFIKNNILLETVIGANMSLVNQTIVLYK
jgi:thioredoxin 1